MITEHQSIIVPQDHEGRRLDQALDLLFPDAGLRERKRLWERYKVLVDGRARPKGYRLQGGQQLELYPLDASQTQDAPAVAEGVHVVGQNTGYMAAVFKPAGVHSESIAGRPGPAVDQSLEFLWSGRFARLVNRLDYLTSGILVVALSEASVAVYRELEDLAQVEKAYVALVEGHLQQPLVLSQALDVARRSKVRVLAEPVESVLRQTFVEPLHFVAKQNATVVRCVIKKGARHQIRAHLSYAGYPIVGDPLYGSGDGTSGLYLHHFRISLPDFQAVVVPLWPQWTDWGLAKSLV